MKVTLVLSLALLGTSSAFSQLQTQGTVFFNNRSEFNISHVWGPSSASPTLSLHGNSITNSAIPGINDRPIGTVNYGGEGMFLIGWGGTSGQYGAATTFTQILGAPGANVAESFLVPSSTPPTSFRTGIAAGNVAVNTSFFDNIPPDAPVGTFEMVVWDNYSGLYSSWALAKPAWLSGLIAAGTSSTFTLQNIGGNIEPPPSVAPALTSFNIYFIPEPMPLVLGGLGAAILIFAFHKRD